MNATLPPPTTSPAGEHITETGTGRTTHAGSVDDAARRSASFPSPREFVRPTEGRRIGGVCAAIADRNGWSRTTVRLVAAATILLPGPQVLAYLIAWVVMPSAAEVERSTI